MAGWKNDILTYGLARSKTTATAARDLVPPKEHHEGNAGYLSKEQADICLQCKRKVCSGSPECFKRQAKEKKK